MSAPTTTINPDVFEAADDPVVKERRRAAVSRKTTTGLRWLWRGAFSVVLTPLLLATLAALVMMFVARLLIELMAAGFDR